MSELSLMVTLWPSFPHFKRFALDWRLSGIRLNSAMMGPTELDAELALADAVRSGNPLWFDVKGRQPRVAEVVPRKDYLELVLNHPITVSTPTPVLFKSGLDPAWLERVEDGGRRLIFGGNPKWKVTVGESLHVRHQSFRIHADPLFTEAEIEKIAKVRAAGINRWFLSYVERWSDIDQFRELVGRDAEIMLKIENERGLQFAAQDFRKEDGLTLVAARGDLYVEVAAHHDIVAATRMLIEKDPEAVVGSRILLSTIHDHVASCADYSELAWLADIGYRRMMLCDELCLKEELLARAVTAFAEFRGAYGGRVRHLAASYERDAHARH